MSDHVEDINATMSKLYEQYVKTNDPLGADISKLLDHIAMLEFDLDYANAKLNGEFPNWDKHQIGHLVVTWAGNQIALVSRQDEDSRILKIIAESGNPPTPVKEYDDGSW